MNTNPDKPGSDSERSGQSQSSGASQNAASKGSGQEQASGAAYEGMERQSGSSPRAMDANWTGRDKDETSDDDTSDKSTTEGSEGAQGAESGMPDTARSKGGNAQSSGSGRLSETGDASRARDNDSDNSNL